MKVKFEDFLTEKISKEGLKKIIDEIQYGIDNNKYKDEFTFNRYSVEIFYGKKKAYVHDDLFFEEFPSLEIGLSQLLKKLKEQLLL